MNKYYEEILEYVDSLTIIDSHEHLPGREASREHDTDILKEYLRHYFDRDLVSAGMKPADMQIVRDPRRPFGERWKMVEPYWDLARNTGYGRSLDLAVKKIYGAERIDGSTIEGLNEAFLKTLEQQGHFRKVLKDLCKIEYSVLDSDLNCDREFFRSAYRLDKFIFLFTWWDIEGVEEEAGIPITCLDDWLEACEIMMDRAFEKGAVVLKCALAYERSLLFERVTKQEAEECFNRFFRNKGIADWDYRMLYTTKAFQDYMMHYILRLANRRGLTLQIHTGLQEGNGNQISHSDPSQLSNLFLEYPNVTFDLFHIGYPYQHVMSALGKMFPNVYLDMCWAHIISPAACVTCLGEWLDSVPVNKIIAFGGDYCLVDGVYGHQTLARMDVSRTLSQKVEDGIFGVEEAKWMAKRMFYENPKSIYENK